VSAAKGLLGRSSARPLPGLGKEGGPGAAAGGPDAGGLCEPTRSTFRGDNPHKVERVAEVVEIRVPGHGTADVILTQPRNAASGGRPAETSPPPGQSPTRCERGSELGPAADAHRRYQRGETFGGGPSCARATSTVGSLRAT
jgi:hypothetical protein